ncbi:MAG: hypothetical protein KDD02_01245 [Phaeodactylibacter sp.]|nr:hypothetical protein [Phaeodactylibacter sp.]
MNITLSDVENNFNNGRRGEEAQFGLPANSLGNLSLPAGFDTYSGAEKALYILNEERTARAGSSYPGVGTVLGLPFGAAETNLSNLAQSHANWLVGNNQWSHTGANGWSTAQRIDNDPVLGTAPNPDCHESTLNNALTENLYYIPNFFPTPNQRVVERALYDWIYADAFTSPAWGHRRACLMQDYNQQGTQGYTNNYGLAGTEGFIGLGANGGVGYNPSGLPTFGGHNDVVVLNFIDPIASPNSCNYFGMGVPLPISLIQFSGKAREEGVQLEWETATETNNSHFILERARGGKGFQAITRVQGAGNTLEKQTYDFFDENPTPGLNYYRLSQVDYDGSRNWLRTISVNHTSGKGYINFHPNPLRGETLEVYGLEKMPGHKAHLSLFSLSGQLLLQTVLETTAAAVSVSLEGVLPGCYLLRLRQGAQYLQEVLVKY